MNKSLRYMNKGIRLILAFLLLQVGAAANACWYNTYAPIEYLTCRLPKTDYEPEESMVKMWHRTLLPDVETKEISKLIYPDGYTIEQIRKLAVSPALKKHLTANGNELMEYVCTMRCVNDQRAQMSNPWYYYYAGEPKSKKLNELADTCLNRLNTRYGDRYALLAARALNTLKRYPELEVLTRTHKFKDKEMEALFRPEYARVLYNMGKYDEAAEIYAKAGDMVSLKWCLEKLGQYQNRLSLISRLADYEENYNLVVSELSTFIRNLENYKYYLEDYEERPSDLTTDIGSLIETAHAGSVINNKYQPIWQYAEAIAYLIDNNDFAKADSVLARINTKKIDPDFGKSIRTLRFITQSSLKPYNDKYIAWVASEAQWLINQSDLEREEWTPDDYYEGDTANEIMFSRNIHVSELYFSDMLHKAVDVIIIPRMIENGNMLAALQLLDIVDYANLTDKEIRTADSHGNASACFAMEVGANVIIKAIGRSKNPQTPLDRLWKKTGSIRDADRWLDFAGTNLLAEGRYKEAIKYLESVSPDYAKSRNISDFTDQIKNPFAPELRGDPYCHNKKVLMPMPESYKLWFAIEMSRLEDTFNDKSASAEKRAEAKLKYGIGMANSVYPCWQLTKYGDGDTVFFPWVDETSYFICEDTRDMIHYFLATGYEIDPYDRDPFYLSHSRLNQVRITGEDLITEALSQIKNPETIASYLKATGYYKTIKHHYANTAIAKELRSHCDSWDMY